MNPSLAADAPLNDPPAKRQPSPADGRPGGGAHGPWNPGLKSQLPRALLPLCTVFRPENVSTPLVHALDLGDFTGITPPELVAFRPERLVVHELLVRVTADFSVPDGSHYEDLGINFRRTARTILDAYIAPHMPALADAYREARARVAAAVEAALEARDGETNAPARSGPRAPARALSILGRILGRRPVDVRPAQAPARQAAFPIERWRERARTSADLAEAAACRALVRIAGAVRARHGAAWGDGALLGQIATEIACNEYASAVLGDLIEPHVARAAEREGFERLPPQSRPVVMNTKGASAAGKSTLRPLQKRLAAKIGVRWEDFALISPDIWRKFLLDYGSLGEHYKYAGTFTGHELAVVDRKLDRYMAAKAKSGRMSHLLIDRFRFDSFAPGSEDKGGNLLTRFGHLVYLFFMITPPEATVERAWKRGLEVGRYKAVDDLLAHNVEAFTGMPALFLHFALRGNREVHYEFLDNSVPPGERPRTIAFGCNGDMNVLDVSGMLNIARFRAINVDARGPEAVYPGAASMAPERNLGFLAECVRSLHTIDFAERDTGNIYARLESGRLVHVDPVALERAMRDDDTRAAVEALAPDARRKAVPQRSEDSGGTLDADAARHTLGQWGSAALEARP